MVAHSMFIAIITVVGNPEHEDALLCPEAHCMDVDLNLGAVDLQWQKPEGTRSARRR